MNYITTHREREALKTLPLYRLKKTVSKRINQYWSLKRCIDSLDIIEDELDIFKHLDMTVEQMLFGRFIYEVLQHRGENDKTW